MVNTPIGALMSVVARDAWLLARSHHHSVTDNWVSDRLKRRSFGLKHPVDDFMFEYYPISPSKLKSWHPGFGGSIQGSSDDYSDFNNKIYEFNTQTISLSASWIEQNHEDISQTITFLESTAKKSALTGCFGLHEWAMVLGTDDVRHQDWPLRVTTGTIRETINEVGLRCTHFDAFRFFTDEARPLNPLQIVRNDQKNIEQPGCLHANMDLYKISHRWAPLVGSALVRACFRLAREIRTLDMRGAPYDLKQLGVDPIPLETSDGRSLFAKEQKQFSQKAQVLRNRLIHQLERALTSAEILSSK